MEWRVLAGAFDTLCASRRQVLWSLPAIRPPPNRKVKPTLGQKSFFLPIPPLLPVGIADFDEEERFVREWKALDFSCEGHPMRFYWAGLERAEILPCAALQECGAGEIVRLAGLCLPPHSPLIAKEETILYLTLKDETAIAHVTCLPDAYEKYGAELLGNSFVFIEGKVERRGVGRILVAQSAQALSR